MTRLYTTLCATSALLWSVAHHAEQMKEFDDWQVHYVVINASFLNPEVAHHYGLIRGPNKALVNVSAIRPDGKPAAVEIDGAFINLLGQRTRLDFEQIVEGDAIYYIAPFDFEDGERLRFEVGLQLPGHGQAELKFDHAVYRER